ncbi:phosphoglycerate dehydrogenase [Candidiatus Paracoxiella cheracis]|uniref:phosphoglycerate dehydrogenase n=1 Tax=Candidiatus Paracoxiella cheracis TaxID=3405120 RepID=UPI003BF56859
MYKIQVLNNISHVGLSHFHIDHYEILQEANNPDAILVRSFNMHDMPIPKSIQVVGRAGVGTNNIPVEKLTALGIPVLNTPGANANAVKELVITGMLLASRNICPAWDYTRQIQGDDQALHHQVEKQKKQFAGFELPGKTLGVIGLGKIGVKVANAAIQLGMNVIGYDPAITVRSAWELSSDVQQAESLKDAIQHSDFVTLHVPLNDKTQHLINADLLKMMKSGVVLLNFARAPIVDNNALAEALDDNHVRNYVCDFPCNRFKNNPHVISLPHLGASTKEAEENCAIMVAEQVQEYLENGTIRNSVNFPAVKLPRGDGYRIAIANLNVPNMVAQISTILSNADLNIIDMINKSRDEIAYTMMDVDTEINDEVFQQIRAIKGVVRARRL